MNTRLFYIILQGPGSRSIKINGKMSTPFRSAMNHWEVLSCLITILIFTVNTHLCRFLDVIDTSAYILISACLVNSKWKEKYK